MSDYNVNELIGLEIRKYREGRKLSQFKCAEICNVDPTYFGRIERGEFNVTVFQCYKIARGFGIRLSDLFENIPD